MAKLGIRSLFINLREVFSEFRKQFSIISTTTESNKQLSDDKVLLLCVPPLFASCDVTYLET
jgi:hypothetical protein